MNRLFLSTMFLLLLSSFSGCSFQPETSFKTTSTAAKIQPTITTIPKTATPKPTKTPNPSPTPTLSFPLRHNTPIPELELPMIGLENASNLVEVARYGFPNKLGCQVLSPGSDLYISVDLDGISIVNQTTKLERRVVNAPLSVKTGIISMYAANPGAGASKDGNYFVIFTEDDEIQIWNDKNEKLYSLEIPEEQISKYSKFLFRKPVSASLSADGKYLAVTDPTCDVDNSINQCKIQIIDWKQNIIITSLPGYYADFSTGGKFLVVYFDNKINVYNTQSWEIVFYEMHPSMGYGINHKFSPKDTYFVIFTQSRVSAYRTEKFKNSMTLKDFKTYYPPEVLFSSDESLIYIKSSFMASPPELYTFDIKSGALVSKETYEKMQQSFFDKIDQLKGCSISQAEQENLEVEIPYFSEIWMKDAGLSIFQGEEGHQIKYHDSLELPGYVKGLWQNSIIIGQGASDQFGWYGDELGILDLRNGEYTNLKTVGKNHIKISKGSYWLVFWKGEPTKVFVYDAEKKGIISERIRLNTDNMSFYPLEKWNAVGYIDNNNCAKSYSIIENQELPKEVCLPIVNGNRSSILEGESVSSVTTTDLGKLVILGTTKGNLILYDTETSEMLKLKLSDTQINDIAISENGNLISTYSFDDNFTRLWGILGTQTN